ncbi:MAG: tyrosine-type recombinase/integrase [Vicinamibacterales bacterium]
MPTTLTARTVERLKPGARQRDVWDSVVSGLGLRISPNGTKSWSLRYRVGRRLRRWTMGTFPAISLADARARARNALRDLSQDGHDPALGKRARRDAETVGEFVETYITQYAKIRKKSWKSDEMRLAKDVLPGWRHRLMKDITRRDVRELLAAVAGRPAPIVANRTRSVLHKMFNFAIELEVVETNPVTRTSRPGIERARDRVLSEQELRILWASFEELPQAMCAFYKLRLFTAQRGGEVAAMRWQDVDLESGWWTIPSSGSKNRLAHRVPLGASALAIVAERLATARREAVYVLEGARGKRQLAGATATFTVQDFRGHDLRRTAASMMASSGIPRLTIGKILNHVDRSITAVYDRHSYDPEKRAALDWWDLRVCALVENADGARVLPFARA